MDYSQYIGIPYENGGRDETLDCYGLVRKLLLDDQGIVVPTLNYQSAIEELAKAVAISLSRGNWQPIERVRGAVILFRIKGMASHIGYYIGNDQFIHSWQPSGGVVIERLSSWKKRVLGYYRYVE